MAYAWTAVYGYYLQSSTGGDYFNLNNAYTTDSGFHISTPTTLFTLPESLTLPSPVNVSSRHNLTVAKERIITLTEFNYITLIPYCNPDSSAINPLSRDLYLKWITAVEQVLPGAFFYDRALVSDAYEIRNGTKCLFVWLTDINIIIDHQGAIFSVNPSTNKITLISNAGNYFEFLALHSSQNIQTTTSNDDGYAYIAFRYAGSWYINNIFIRSIEENANITYEYRVWNNSNQTARIQNQINNNLIGTEDNPKYKYKTDPADPDTDPYTPPFTPLTPSGPGGGDGTHDPEHDGDPAPIPDITQFPSILSSEFITAWNVTPAQLNQLGSYLWSTNFWGIFSSMFINPFDVLLGLSLVPVPVTVNPTGETIKFGLGDSLVISHRITTQFYEVDCGGFNCDKIWGSYLDYQIRFELYLPFIGYKPLQAEDVIGHNLTVKYHVDAITGACIAYVLTDDFCTYTFAGSCGYNIPLTGANYSNLISSILNTAGSVAAAAIAPEAMAGAAALNAAGSAVNTMQTKPQYTRSGALSGNSAFMGMRVPVLLSYVPRACIPERQNKIMGYPSYQTKKLSGLTGYTEVFKIHLDGIGATDTEKLEIEQALTAGVIL